MVSARRRTGEVPDAGFMPNGVPKPRWYHVRLQRQRRGRAGRAEARSWYRKAAEQGDAAAQYNLGVMYDKGEGVPQDYQEAVGWYRKAAEQGDASAQHNLGFMYANGDGVPQDYVQAHKWVNLAASRTTTRKAEDYRVARDKLAEKMTASQVAEAQRLAREWRPKTWEQLKGK